MDLESLIESFNTYRNKVGFKMTSISPLNGRGAKKYIAPVKSFRQIDENLGGTQNVMRKEKVFDFKDINIF